jgi:hypothetical protein
MCDGWLEAAKLVLLLVCLRLSNLICQDTQTGEGERGGWVGQGEGAGEEGDAPAPCCRGLASPGTLV